MIINLSNFVWCGALMTVACGGGGGDTDPVVTNTAHDYGSWRFIIARLLHRSWMLKTTVVLDCFR